VATWSLWEVAGAAILEATSTDMDMIVDAFLECLKNLAADIIHQGTPPKARREDMVEGCD